MEHSLPKTSSFSNGNGSAVSSASYQQLVKQVSEFAIFIVDTQGRIASWNEGARRLFGYPEDEAVGSDFALLFTPEDLKSHAPEEELRNAERDGRAEDTRWHLRKDGSRIFCEGVVTALHDEMGQITGYAKVVRDETPRKQVEEELVRSQERFDLVARATNDTVWDWNLETDEVWWNENVVMLYGLAYNPNPCDASWWYEHIHPEDRERVVSSIHEVIDHGKQTWSQEYRCLREDGGIAYVLDRGYALLNEEGRPVRMLGAMTNITQRKKSEQEREQLIEEAEAGNRLKDEFLATLSHELRTPLQSILGYANLLRSGQLGEEDSERALETIERSALAQSALIEDVLDVSRILTGKIRLDVQPVDMAKCIGGALEAINPAAIAKDIRLILDLSSDVPPVTGDAARLQQVMWNLLSNAIKFTPRGGSVTVSLERREDNAQVSVKDTGQGIPRQFLPHVFDRFRQADSSSTRAHSGLGLGLAIVRQMVELHGGTIRAYSEGTGRGATFTIQIPQSNITSPKDTNPNPSDTITARVEKPTHHELDGVQALVVEDQDDARELVRILLQGRGAKVKAVGSVAEALKFLKSNEPRPDIILSDIGMAGQDGYAFVEQLRALEVAAGSPRVPAVALTAFASSEDKAKALDAGFDQHVSKPIQGAELIAIVRHYTMERAH